MQGQRVTGSLEQGTASLSGNHSNNTANSNNNQSGSNTGSPTLSSFRDVVYSAFRSGRHSSQDGLPSQSQSQSQQRRQSSASLQLSNWQTAAPARNVEEFPSLSQEMIKTIWSGDEQSIKCVDKAIEEMQLNWQLDPKLVAGERSEANHGYAVIVTLLRHIALANGKNAGNRRSQFGATDEEDVQNLTIVQPSSSRNASSTRPTKAYERHDLLRAIEKQDHETILEIRNQNFDLLLDSAPGTTSSTSGSGSSSMQTPLGYTISLGATYTSTAIILAGVMSKYVNNLPDHLPRRKGDASGEGWLDNQMLERIKKLKMNLKLAIDTSLQTDQTMLLSSYIQILFMSNGISFITDSVSTLTLSIRNNSTNIVSESREIILQFITHNLKKKYNDSNPIVAGIQDLIDNATGDLILMAFWSILRQPASDDLELKEQLPPYAFARDDRITTIYIQRVNLLQSMGTSASTAANMAQVWRKATAVKDSLQGLETGIRRMNAKERLQRIQVVAGK
ncbi:unnamed protein product [Sympodiomycopsis kandeliae]